MGRTMALFVFGIAACGGEAGELCPQGFDPPQVLAPTMANAGMGGDAFTIVWPGREPAQLVLERRDFDGNVLVREFELTADGADPLLVRFSDSGDFVSWIEGFDTPQRLLVGRIASDGAIADVATVADAGALGAPRNFVLVDAGAGTAAVLWGNGFELFLTLVTAGQAAAPITIGPHDDAIMIAANGELAIGWADDRGAWLERRGLDGRWLEERLVVPDAPVFNAMCWDGDGYQIVVDSVAVAHVRADATTVTSPRPFTDEDAGGPTLVCGTGGAPSVAAWTQALTRGPSGNIETSDIMLRELDRAGTPLGRASPATARTDALNVFARLHAARDGSLVVLWNEYSEAAPSGVQLVAARCRP